MKSTLSCRKAKALPVPQLVKPGSVHESDIWDCAVLLVDKTSTCGKLKYVLKVKKVSAPGQHFDCKLNFCFNYLHASQCSAFNRFSVGSRCDDIYSDIF